MVKIVDNKLKLSGLVAEFPLIEVVQFLGMTEKTGVLQIQNIPLMVNHISLYLKKGRLIHAASDGRSGIDIFYMAMSLETGEFTFISGVEVNNISIDKPIHVLLLESQQYTDELKNIRSLLPSDETILFIAPVLETIPPLNKFEWYVISMINGRRSIHRICQKIGDELAAKTAIRNLLSVRVLTTSHPEDEWKHIIPLHIPSDKIHSERPYPPQVRTNLLLKSINGKLSIKQISHLLNCDENELMGDFKLLYDTGWITFAPEHEALFLRNRNEN